MYVISVVGARPQFIKAAMLTHAIASFNACATRITHKIIHTGQHYDADMSDIFFEELQIVRPEWMLDLRTSDTSTLRDNIANIIRYERPDIVTLFGDTNTTCAAAMACNELNIPIAHIEAGLRSFNLDMAEERNRIFTDQVADFLFCPTPTAVYNLQRENIKGKIFNVGDIMYDAALHYSATALRSNILSQLNLEPKNFFLATIHRAENLNSASLRNIITALSTICRSTPVVWPLHPHTKQVIHNDSQLKELLENSHITIVPPTSYFDTISLEINARKILTDSGGIQKEAFFFRTPCVTLRNETEWVETVTYGWNILTGCNTQKIVSAAFAPSSPQDFNHYGNGTCAPQIVDILWTNFAS